MNKRRTFAVTVLSVLLLSVTMSPYMVKPVEAAEGLICKCIGDDTSKPTVGVWKSGIKGNALSSYTPGGEPCVRCGAANACNPITDACISAPFPIPTVGNLLTSLIRLFFFIASLLALIYILLGAFDWVRSGGKEEEIEGAQKKIMAAVVGLIVMVAVLTLVIIIEQVIFSGTVCLGISCPIQLDKIGLVDRIN